ncbi:MAG: site-specific integrase [Clostridia bacterium]|nr:site-specific integrase [Clostridia bacterium]
MKYKHWLTEWLENYVKPVTKHKTYLRYYDIVQQHVKVQLGNYELKNLTPLVLQHYTMRLLKSGNLKTGRGLSVNTVNGIVTVIQTSLRSAYSVGQLNEYFGDKIQRPRSFQKEITSFTVSEQKKIEREILSCPKPRMFGIVLCLYTGLRIGELLALEWKDVDFQKCTVSVNKTLHDGKDVNGRNTRIIDEPKTANSKRVIPFPKQLLPYLRNLKSASKTPFVVSSTKGKAVFVRSYQKSFEVCLKKLNIPHKGFHALRHTFATRAIECGMDVKTLSEILGHKNATVTLNKYVHSFMEHKKEMMNKLGKMLP